MWFQKENNTFKSGAAIDTRTEPQKLLDYKFDEIVAKAEVVDWRKKPPAEWRKFHKCSQNGSASCVAHTEAREMGIMRFLLDGNFVRFSAADIYQRRANRPNGGMNATNAREIIRKEGATLEILAPSDDKTDAQIDATKIEPYKREVGAVFAVPNYIELPARSIEDVASVIQRTKKGVMVWFYFEFDEWNIRPRIKHEYLRLDSPEALRHSVTAVDYTLTEDGKRALIIEDSFTPNSDSNNQRVIDEDFFKVRNWYSSHLMNFRFDQVIPIKPVHTFNVDLYFGLRNSDVVFLQDCLKYEGCYPSNVNSEGLFGAITKDAVIKFQKKYGINPIGRVGPQTRAKLNSLYGKA